MNGFLLIMLIIAFIGLISAVYLWWRTNGVPHYAILVLVVGFILAMIYVEGVVWLKWDMDFMPVILLIIMGCASLYVCILAVEDIVKRIRKRGQKERDKTYKKTLEAMNNDKRTGARANAA